jgi:hypothetical protein
MAKRRMFALTIIDSDAFTDMPLSTQALYFHLSMRADDDGFINNPKKIMRMIGASEDDFKLLVLKKFILPFDSGIVVIKHWKIHNYIPKDRYTPTVYTEEKTMLEAKENGAYTLCIQDAYNMDTQVKLGKSSLSKDKVVEVSGDVYSCDNLDDVGNVENSEDNSFEYVGGTLGKGVVLLTKEQNEALLEKLGIDAFNHYVEKLATFIIKNNAKVSNHYNTILRWAKEDAMV